ncbi:MAG: nucleotidyl transferase AbiEii/AbiGii toxin family protein [Ignavibacteria bacterium]|nr:nucleotidyl transferase AbiEii/AbiGii toxin family protein [Ignavibacteria bacterium]
MISEKSFSKEWIEKKSKEFKISKYDILEKANKALYLLEKLKESELDFIFKGGTALTILLKEEKRFSTDIDITTKENDKTIEKILENIVFKKYFKKYEIENRESKSKIKKTHYRLFYDSVITGYEQNVLLDVVFCDLIILDVINTEIKSNFIDTKGTTFVKTLSIESLLGDKLTTLAFNSIGIDIKNDLGIAKQVFDINRLFDEITNIKKVELAFLEICKLQLQFRGLKTKENQILNEIIENVIIFVKGYYGINLKIKEKEYFNCFISGLDKLQNNIIPKYDSGKFSRDSFLKSLTKSAFLCSVLNSGDLKNFVKYNKETRLEDLFNYEHKDKLNKLKKLDKESHYYLITALKISGLD